MWQATEEFWDSINQFTYNFKIETMKKNVLASAVVLIFIACGGGASEKTAASVDAAKTPAAPAVSDDPAYQEGLALVAKPENLCLSCHKIEEKLTGPAYRDVANKYENTPENITLLATKVVKGGVGVWGDVAMPPNASVNQSDAEKMVKYILMLRSK